MYSPLCLSKTNNCRGHETDDQLSFNGMLFFLSAVPIFLFFLGDVRSHPPPLLDRANQDFGGLFYLADKKYRLEGGHFRFKKFHREYG
jgi:hypothetical protein